MNVSVFFSSSVDGKRNLVTLSKCRWLRVDRIGLLAVSSCREGDSKDANLIASSGYIENTPQGAHTKLLVSNMAFNVIPTARSNSACSTENRACALPSREVTRLRLQMEIVFAKHNAVQLSIHYK